jgi:hypothetical protein
VVPGQRSESRFAEPAGGGDGFSSFAGAVTVPDGRVVLVPDGRVIFAQWDEDPPDTVDPFARTARPRAPALHPLVQ